MGVRSTFYLSSSLLCRNKLMCCPVIVVLSNKKRQTMSTLLLAFLFFDLFATTVVYSRLSASFQVHSADHSHNDLDVKYFHCHDVQSNETFGRKDQVNHIFPVMAERKEKVNKWSNSGS